MCYILWLIYLPLALLKDLSALVAAPLFCWIGWPAWAWAIWGNDQGFLTDIEDPLDNPRTLPYWQAVRWLWRNPAANGSRLMGVVIQKAPTITNGTRGDPTDDGGARGGRSGWRFVRQRLGFEFYLVWQYPIWPARCLRVRLGWKLHGNTPGTIAPMVHHVNPLKSFKLPSGDSHG